MVGRVSFYCPSCRARLRASVRFACRTCACPKCGAEVTVPAVVPAEQAPVLVMDEGHRTRRKQARY